MAKLPKGPQKGSYEEIMEGTAPRKAPIRLGGGFRRPKPPPNFKKIPEPSPYEREMEGYPPGDVTVREKEMDEQGHYPPRKQKTNTSSIAGGRRKIPRPKKTKRTKPQKNKQNRPKSPKRPKRPKQKETLKVRKIKWI